MPEKAEKNLIISFGDLKVYEIFSFYRYILSLNNIKNVMTQGDTVQLIHVVILFSSE